MTPASFPLSVCLNVLVHSTMTVSSFAIHTREKPKRGFDVPAYCSFELFSIASRPVTVARLVGRLLSHLRHEAELLHHLARVAVAPAVNGLAVLVLDDVDAVHVDRLLRRLDRAEEHALVRAGHRALRDDVVADRPLLAVGD